MKRLILPILSLAVLLLAPESGQAPAASPVERPDTRPDSGPATTPATTSAATPATGPATTAAGPATLPSPPLSRPAASPVERAASGPAGRPAPGPTTRPAGGASTPLAASPALVPAVPWDDYQIIVTRNIFSKDRGRRPPTRGPIIPVIPPRLPSGDNYIVLTGTLVQGDLRLAFFEDGRSGQTEMVAEGRPYLSGTVVAVSLDHVEYRTAQGLRTVAIGQNLRGVETAVYLAAALPTTMPASTQPTTGAALEPTTLPAGVLPSVRPPGMSMEEWMRLRRLQENR